MPSLIVNLDKIRSAAHRYGWNDAPYNPFGRVRSNESRLRDPEQARSTTELQTSKDPNAPARQDSDESQRSPTRIGTDKEEISSSTFADGSDVVLRRHPTSVGDAEAVPTQTEPTDSDREEEMKRMRKDILSKKIPLGQQIKTVLYPHWYTINWLLIAAPVGIALKYVHGINPLAVFVVNFLAIIPLAGILSFSTEELALRVGETLGGLLNATFG